MIILTIRTDKPEAEIGLFRDHEQLAYYTWLAHRQLAETIHTKLIELLQGQNLSWTDLQGLVLYKGPGSFTGLRIGATVANTLAYGLGVPIVAGQSNDWVRLGIKRLLAAANDQIILPDYGADPHITLPRK